MLEKFLPFAVNSWAFVLSDLAISAIATTLLYFVSFYILRSIFRKFERDIALVTLNVSMYPVLIAFVIVTLKFSFHRLIEIDLIEGLDRCFTASLIVVISYWFIQLFTQVFIYYLKDYTKQTEVMWDDVLLPLLDAVIPVVIILFATVLVLKSFGVDLTSIWVALGGATFIIGFAVKDILANFFSGVVLLIDTPFQFGDVLRLENGSVGILRKIGVRVTQLYILENHCDVYIPNSVLQGQNITNLSRPTTYYFYSTKIEVLQGYQLDDAKQVMEAAILAHPDTLGDIDRKLELMDCYYNALADQNLAKQQKLGKLRLLAESEVNLKLEEIDQALEALAVTLQFAEKGGLTQDEIDNVQQEYLEILTSIGIEVINTTKNNRLLFEFIENRLDDTLIKLVRQWYRAWIRDPNLLNEDEAVIPDEWELKINMLKRRVQRLFLKISNPQREETRLDDYVMELKQWLRERFKEPRRKWQEPQILMTGTNHDESGIYIEFKLNFFVDDIKLENGRRGDRISSQIYEEVVRYLKSSATPEAKPQNNSKPIVSV
ncbi:MscS Mechanosensitive ion channel [Crinalium epipsammum PCC 9333]|uniref:MscS Mechanosensitive ion channel n=1 Tax=Crinalium epipsammum PCC 9333 TaxID=1173022 RepID=K9VX78_9CYAN|nr:mechanosensitive ion channel family protein [Crinalium epipsammum]AFZ12718.1 MscS Mechanosensitive ion channel [Crinalium epipsammum PCC 9333]